MKRWQLQSIILFALLFTSLNLYLIIKKESKIERIEHVSNWGIISRGNLEQTIKAQGVVAPSEEYPIYFDIAKGSFQEFLVKEGDEVSVGTPLFQYSPNDIQLAMEDLQSEVEAILDKIDHMDDHISNLKDLKADFLSKDEDSDMYRLYSIEKEIYEKELEKSLLEEDVTKTEKQIDALESQSESLIMTSNFEGQVKNVQHSLHNPIITLVSNTVTVKGKLSETELKKVREGMETIVWSNYYNRKSSGTLLNISTIPEQEPSIDQPSHYPFKVELDEEENWISGNHVGLSFIIQKAENVIIVPRDSISQRNKDNFVHVLTSSGTMEKREIQTGLLVNGKQEITSGLENDEFIASKAMDIKQNGNTKFITPLTTKHLSKSGLKQNLKNDWKYILIGILSN